MESGGKVETYDFREDFKALTPLEKRVALENAKNLLKVQKAGKGVNEEPYQYGGDFKGLSALERQEVLENAKRLLKLQKENAILADAPVPPNEAEKGLG
jgi:hypothetical protein